MVVAALASLALSLTLANAACETECTCISGRCCQRDTENCGKGDQCFCKRVIENWHHEACEDADRRCAVNPDIFFALFFCFFLGNFVLFPLFMLWHLGTDLFRKVKRGQHVVDAEVEEIEAVALARDMP